MSDLTRREHLALLSSVISLSAAACCCSSNLNASLEVESAPIRRDYPHFARDGSLLVAYDPKRSIFVRTLFQLNFDDLAANPDLEQDLRDAGINTITTGLYANPADGGISDYAKWYEGWSGYWRNVEGQAERLGMTLLLSGDDIMREQYQMANSITVPWSAVAIRTALETAKHSNRVIGVEMMDEAVGDIIPPDFMRLMQIVRTARDRPYLTWPVVSGSSTKTVARWMGDPKMSDYATIYWSLQDGTDRTLEAYRRAMAQTVKRWRPFIQQDRPFLLLVSVAGEFYTKRTSGANYTDGKDLLQGKPNSPRAVAVQIMYAVIAGAAGVRLYLYDGPHLKKERADSPIGTIDLQTGTAPRSSRWIAIAGAMNLIKSLEPFLLQATIPAPDLGPEILTSARVGPSSVLIMALNFSSRTITRNVDLSSYPTSNARVYRLLDGAAKVTTEGINLAQPTTFRPGETVTWLFPL